MDLGLGPWASVYRLILERIVSLGFMPGYGLWTEKIQRGYAYLGERGETLYENGAKTKEEIDLGFEFFDERSPEAASEDYFDRKDLRYPMEDDVMRISAAWTIDTQSLDQRTERGAGVLAKISAGAPNVNS